MTGKHITLKHGEETHCENCGMAWYAGDTIYQIGDTYNYSDRCFCSKECAKEKLTQEKNTRR